MLAVESAASSLAVPWCATSDSGRLVRYLVRNHRPGAVLSHLGDRRAGFAFGGNLGCSRASSLGLAVSRDSRSLIGCANPAARSVAYVLCHGLCRVGRPRLRGIFGP